MKLILFDLDGTLVDSRAQLLQSFAEAFAATGLPQLADEKVLSVVGLSLPLACEKLVGRGEAAERLMHYYRMNYARSRTQSGNAEPPLYSGIPEIIATLSGREGAILGLATGKSRRGVDHSIEAYGWDGLFATIQTADDAPSKPHPAMILQAMAETGAEPSRTAMIGDTTYDIEMAVAAGVTAFGVAWGNHSVEALWQAGASEVLTTREGLGLTIDAFCHDIRGGRTG